MHLEGGALWRMTRFSQFVAVATAHLAGRHSLRDVVANLEAQGPRLYHLGAKPVKRSSLARVNEKRPFTLYRRYSASSTPAAYAKRRATASASRTSSIRWTVRSSICLLKFSPGCITRSAKPR